MDFRSMRKERERSNLLLLVRDAVIAGLFATSSTALTYQTKLVFLHLVNQIEDEKKRQTSA